MTDPIAQALDGFVPAFDSVEGDWQAILEAAAPAAALTPADRGTRRAPRRGLRRALHASRAIRVALALALLAVLTTGVAWAAGAFDSPTPHALFGGSFPVDTGAGPVRPGAVIRGTVQQVASVEIPKVGQVALWHADTTKGGWCLGLRLSNRDWLGTDQSPLDSGGNLPGCFPAGVIDPGNDHLEWLEDDIDARSLGGDVWRIRTGVITAPGAVKVTDLTTGQSTKVIDGDLFILAIRAPSPEAAEHNSPRLHLVAYDEAGKVIASDCRSCSDG